MQDYDEINSLLAGKILRATRALHPTDTTSPKSKTRKSRRSRSRSRRRRRSERESRRSRRDSRSRRRRSRRSDKSVAAGKAARKVAPPPIQIAYQAGKGGIQKGPGRHHPEGWQQRTTLRTIRRLERLETPIMHEARFETVLREIAQETQSAEEWNNQRTKIRFQRSAVI